MIVLCFNEIIVEFQILGVSINTVNIQIKKTSLILHAWFIYNTKVCSCIAKEMNLHLYIITNKVAENAISNWGQWCDGVSQKYNIVS